MSADRYQEDDDMVSLGTPTITPAQSADYFARRGEAAGEQWWGECWWCGSDCASPQVCPNGPTGSTKDQ